MGISKIQDNDKIIEELIFVEKNSSNVNPAFIVRTIEGQAFNFGVSDYFGTWKQF